MTAATYLQHMNILRTMRSGNVAGSAAPCRSRNEPSHFHRTVRDGDATCDIIVGVERVTDCGRPGSLYAEIALQWALRMKQDPENSAEGCGRANDEEAAFPAPHDLGDVRDDHRAGDI